MTEPILCRIRDKQPPYAFCVDEKGERSRTQVVVCWPRGITRLQCLTNPKDHKFKIDQNGDVINE